MISRWLACVAASVSMACDGSNASFEPATTDGHATDVDAGNGADAALGIDAELWPMYDASGVDALPDSRPTVETSIDVRPEADVGTDTRTDSADAATVEDAATAVERGRCLSGAPRLQWTSKGCFDSTGVQQCEPCTLMVPFYCEFQIVNNAGARRCIPALAGRIRGYSIAEPLCSKGPLLDAVNWTSTDSTSAVSDNYDNPAYGVWRPYWAYRCGRPGSGLWAARPPEGGLCAKQYTPYPYANPEGRVLCLNNPIPLDRFVAAP
jgi:hypothetical protein